MGRIIWLMRDGAKRNKMWLFMFAIPILGAAYYYNHDKAEWASEVGAAKLASPRAAAVVEQQSQPKPQTVAAQVPQAEASAPGACKTKTYVVKDGDWLSVITRAEYGDMMLYWEVASFNGIESPDLIFPGQKILLPCRSPEWRAIAPKPRNTNTVKKARATSMGFADSLTAPAVVSKEVEVPVRENRELPVPNGTSVPVAPPVPPVSDQLPGKTNQPVPTEFLLASATPMLAPRPTASTTNFVLAPSRASESAPATSVSAPSKVSARAMSVPKPKTYAVVLNVPNATARQNGIVPGTFPAVLLEGEKNDGTWKSRRKMTVTVQAAGDDFVCNLVLRRIPPKNAAVAIDFENGNSLLVTSDLLSQGAASEVIVPKTKKRKSYSALAVAYPVRQSFALKALRFGLSVAIPLGSAALTRNPVALGMVPVSILGNVAASKIARNQRQMEELQNPPLHVEYAIAGQQEQIDKLEQEIQSLVKRLDSAGQTETASKERGK